MTMHFPADLPRPTTLTFSNVGDHVRLPGRFHARLAALTTAR